MEVRGAMGESSGAERELESIRDKLAALGGDEEENGEVCARGKKTVAGVVVLRAVTLTSLGAISFWERKKQARKQHSGMVGKEMGN